MQSPSLASEVGDLRRIIASSALDGGALADAQARHRTIPELWSERSRRVGRGETVVEPDAADPFVHFVGSGWACEFRLLAGGGRQIVALLLPRDFCGLGVGAGVRAGSGVCAITPCEIASIPKREVREAMAADPWLAATLWNAVAKQHRVLTERLVSAGRRPALERMAHFLCELSIRSPEAGSAPDDWIALPMTQGDVADVLGMSAVHVNRVLQTLRSTKLLDVRRGRFQILDRPRLVDLAGFDPGYLS